MTAPTREQVEAICTDLDEHAKDERGYCDMCMLRWPCGAVEIREALRALLAEMERQAAELREAHTRTAQIHDTLAEVVTGEWDTPTMAVLAVAEVKRLREDKARLDGALVTIIMHTAHLPGAPNELLAGLLASVRRIADAARREGGA